jgi:hypothetical protein
MNHPDLRVDGKIFATLWKGDRVLLLTRDQQESLVSQRPEVFSPVKGGWGRRGSTTVHLWEADKKSVAEAMRLAWSNKAKARVSPKK